MHGKEKVWSLATPTPSCYGLESLCTSLMRRAAAKPGLCAFHMGEVNATGGQGSAWQAA